MLPLRHAVLVLLLYASCLGRRSGVFERRWEFTRNFRKVAKETRHASVQPGTEVHRNLDWKGAAYKAMLTSDNNGGLIDFRCGAVYLGARGLALVSSSMSPVEAKNLKEGLQRMRNTCSDDGGVRWCQCSTSNDGKHNITNLSRHVSEIFQCLPNVCECRNWKLVPVDLWDLDMASVTYVGHVQRLCDCKEPKMCRCHHKMKNVAIKASFDFPKLLGCLPSHCYCKPGKDESIKIVQVMSPTLFLRPMAEEIAGLAKGQRDIIYQYDGFTRAPKYLTLLYKKKMTDFVSEVCNLGRSVGDNIPVSFCNCTQGIRPTCCTQNMSQEEKYNDFLRCSPISCTCQDGRNIDMVEQTLEIHRLYHGVFKRTMAPANLFKKIFGGIFQ